MVHDRPATHSTLRKVAIAGIAGAVVLSLAACASSERGQNSGGKTGGTLTFGAEGAPKLFDPFYATDGATFRVTRQIFEGLVGFKPGTAQVAPQLADSWDQTPDGKTWTFHLKSGVKFTDGTDFNADATCANFNRWYGQTGAAQSDAVTEYWSDNFGGFSDGKTPSLFKSCTAKDPNTAVVELTKSTSKFPDMLGLTAFAMQSPTAMKQYDANNVQAQGDSFSFPAYATEHPTGTGPFKLVKYDKANNTVELARNDNYHGDKAKLDKLVFKIIPDETARKQALQAGDIDAYDFPAPADWSTLKQNYKLEIRPAFNILYLGINEGGNPKLTDPKVRQALAYGINRAQLVKSQLPEGATVADEFIPNTVDGFNSDVTKYPYDPAKAKQLLAEAGASDLTLNFYWPSEVTRPYMPNPKDIFGAMSADLTKIGVKVNATTKPWNGGYLDDVNAHKPDVFLLGWTGDYNTPDNFLSSFFGKVDNRMNVGKSPWGESLVASIKSADAEPDKAKRTELYKALNAQLVSADYLPAIPISNSPPAIVVKNNVQGLIPSPLTAEEFGPVSVG